MGPSLIENGKISHAAQNFQIQRITVVHVINLETLGKAERLAGTEQGGSIVMPSIKVRDFNFTSLSRPCSQGRESGLGTQRSTGGSLKAFTPLAGDFYHGCQEKGQEKGWKEEGREEEVGFHDKRGIGESRFPFLFWDDRRRTADDGNYKKTAGDNHLPSAVQTAVGRPLSVVS